MRLDKTICLGGRLDGKEVLGIKYYKYIIYPIEEDYSDYIIVFASEGTANNPYLSGYNGNDYTVEESIDDSGLIITKIKPVDINKLPIDIDFSDNATVKKIMKFYGNYHTDGYLDTSFSDCKLLEYVNISELNINNITDLHNMFNSCRSLTTIVGLDTLNTSHITDMASMFNGCRKLKSINLSSFDVSSVTDMSAMFNNCGALKKIDLSNFYTDNLINTHGIFYLCSELEEVDMRNFDMTNVPKVIVNGGYIPPAPHNCEMFGHCNKLRSIRLDNCSNDTIDKIINSFMFPTGEIEGVVRKIYCKKENAAGLTPPDGWKFDFTIYDEPTETLFVPESTVEVTEEQLIVSEDFITYDADNENLNIE